MYNIHHEADTTLFARKHLESLTSSLASTRHIDFRTRAPSGPRKVRELPRQSQGRNAGPGWPSETSPRLARYGNVCAQASKRQASAENFFLISVLIDSDVLIEVTRARDHALLARWNDLSNGDTPLLCSPVTVAELWHGARPTEQPALNALFAAIECVAIDARIGQRAGDYLRQFFRSHHVELADALIAATASIHNFQLWTRNRRHYPMKDLLFY